MLFKRNLSENRDQCNLVKGMIYASKAESYNYGHEIAMKAQNNIGLLYEELSENDPRINEIVKEFGQVCSLSTANDLIYGDISRSGYVGPNIIIPRNSIDPNLARELDTVSITDGLIDGIQNFIKYHEDKNSKKKEVDYDELRTALVECGITEPDKAILAMLMSGDVFANEEIEVTHF